MKRSQKRCGGCGSRKPVAAFNRCKTGRLGLHNHCRQCQKKCKREYYLRNIEKERMRSAAKNKTQEAIAWQRRYYACKRDTILAKNRARRAKPEARAKANATRNRRYRNDAAFRLAVCLRHRVRKALMGIAKSRATLVLLGCDLEYFKRHLEARFLPGMTWENYGYRGWHIDHIRPCATFDLSDPQQQAECFHFSNMRPMWRFDNQSRGCRPESEDRR